MMLPATLLETRSLTDTNTAAATAAADEDESESESESGAEDSENSEVGTPPRDGGATSEYMDCGSSTGGEEGKDALSLSL